MISQGFGPPFSSGFLDESWNLVYYSLLLRFLLFSQGTRGNVVLDVKGRGTFTQVDPLRASDGRRYVQPLI